MDPKTNQPLVNNEPNVIQPVLTQESVTMPNPSKNNSKIIILVAIIILILGGGYLIYTKFMNKDENLQQKQDILTTDTSPENITIEEKASVDRAFNTISDLLKNKSIEGLQKYISSTNGKLTKINFSGHTKSDTDTIIQVYNSGFKDIVDDKILNKEVSYTKRISAGNIYFDMLISGETKEEKGVNVYVEFTHTFTLIGNDLFWVDYNYYYEITGDN